MIRILAGCDNALAYLALSCCASVNLYPLDRAIFPLLYNAKTKAMLIKNKKY